MGVTQVPVSAEFQAGQPLWQVTVETPCRDLRLSPPALDTEPHSLL